MITYTLNNFAMLYELMFDNTIIGPQCLSIISTKYVKYRKATLNQLVITRGRGVVVCVSDR